MRGRSLFPRKIQLALVLATFVATGTFGVFGAARKAAAQPAVAPAQGVQAGLEAKDTVETTVQTSMKATDLSQGGTRTGLAVKEEAKATWRVALQNTAAIALLNGLNYFAQKVAYDAAVYVAAGGKGQVPLIFDSPGRYFKSVGADAAGEILGSLTANSDFLKKYGINLCAPTNPRIALNLKLGFLKSLPSMGVTTNVPTPKCSWDSIQNNWESFTTQDPATVLDNVGVMFSPGESSLAAAIEVNNVALKEINLRKYTTGLEYTVGQGFKAVTDKISGVTKTPASTVKNTFDYSVQEGFKVKDDTKAVGIGAIGSGAFAVLTPALKTFAGTLTEKLMKKVFERGLISVSDLLGLEVDLADLSTNFSGTPPIGGRASAELANTSLLTPKILTLTNYSELTDFSACPTENRGPNNCVIDQQFYTAISLADQGRPVTVRQAVQQGFLNRGWQLLPLAHRKNAQSTCFNEAFCYSNLVKLRKARIIPIGWELAANSAQNDVNRPVTLGEAMDRFDDCPMTVDAEGNSVVDETKLPSPLHPWCHLVDPEWVLKYPLTICRQQAPGPVPLSSQSATRVQSCVDVATCVNEDAAGNCIGGYGYCIREKSAWKFDADACPAQFASCTSYRRADGASFPFLANTLDAGPCNSQNAGCRRYSLSPNAVPNAGFEDVIDDGPRDWTLTGQASHHRGGRLSMRGSSAVGVSGISTARADIGGLLPGSYRLSGSVLQEIENTSALGTVRVSFLDDQGAPVAPPATPLETTCDVVASGTAVELDIVSSSLGYLSGTCEVTLPADAVAAVVTLSSNAPVGNDTWFDEIGFFGNSFSTSPLDGIFMNGKVEKCTQDQAGCTEFVRLSTGTLNVLRNPSFETSDGTVPAFWNGADASRYENGTLQGEDGTSAYALSTAAVSQTVEGILADASYSFSISTRLAAAGATTGLATLQMFDTQVPPQPVAPTSADGCQISGTSLRLPLAAGTTYVTSGCSFTTPGEVGSIVVRLTASAATPRLLADAAMLELAVSPTGYHETYSASAQRVSLKKAPEGLNCAGSNPPADCSRYAPSCRRDEVGCNAYTPVDGGSVIPAVTTDADACPAECAGYDTFRQEPSNFTDARFPLFLIPTTGRACTAAEAGCSEFTNIERLSAGGESREYFTYLRLCAAPGPRSGTYYTWEGNDERGFQLRTWALLRSDIENASVGVSDPSGGNAPCTKLGYDVSGLPICVDDALSVADASCSKDLVGVNPDCREFYDEAGNIHYRLYSKTIVSTEDCKEYRITKTSESECDDHGGFWRNGECRYRAYSAESIACRAAAAGCRAYSGNASRNVKIVSTDTFEAGTTDGWIAPGADPAAGVVNSNESVSAGGHSLKATRNDVIKPVGSSITLGKQYILTFWAKGTGDLSLRLSQAGDAAFTFNRAANAPAPVSLTTEWRPYQVGPVEVVRPPAADERVIVERSVGGSPLFFLDNVELREVTGNIFLIEDSWETPTSCDETPTGDPAPQYMLGCRAYRDRENITAHFKSFEKLCRPEAVGCEALYDTRNDASPFASTFRAVCTLASACTGISCPCSIDGDQVCQVTAGSTTCRYDVADAVPAANVSPDGDTVRVPADAITYLVNDPRFRCADTSLGCVEAGDRTMKPDRFSVQSWTPRYIKNLPANYALSLCKKTEEFCQAYTRRSDAALVHFKDPDTRTCEFREGTLLSANGISASGWFRKGSNEACDPDFLEAGTRFGIWKNSDADYDGWVGTCEDRYDMCKEFIDPEDRSTATDEGRPYYAILNDRLDVKTCQGRVSLEQSPSSANDASSCVLFWQTDNLKKTYDAKATYDASEAANGALVTPLSTATNTANIVIKVKRDRQCGEWLDCRTSETVFNPSSGTYQNVCTAFSLCAEFERVGNSTRCIRYVDSAYSGELLTDGHYEGRDTSWEGMEYSGYAIPNRYPIEELVTVNVGASFVNPDLRLVRPVGTCTSAYGTACGPASDRGTCLGPCGTPDGSLAACPSGSTRTCVQPIDGGRLLTNPAQLNQAQTAAGYPGASCRAYPQENAPFPSTVADPGGWDFDGSELNNGNPVLTGPNPAYAGANVCQRRLINGQEVSSCECSYFIARYGSQTKFFPAESADIPQGYCVTGQYEGFECDPLATGARRKSNLSCCTTDPEPSLFGGSFTLSGCDDGAQCVRINKLDRVVGYEGQCLERDFTTPINGRADEFACLTWRPVGLIGGSRDIYNQYQSAGYFAAEDRRFYCVGDQDRWHLPLTITTSDTNGDGVVNPYDQPTTNFFGPGKVSSKVDHYQSRGGDCSGDADSLQQGGGWCIYPGISEPVAVVEGSTERKYGLTGDSIGILGCYEVSDNTKSAAPTIVWPYIGKPIYRAQLEGMYFQIVDDIYWYGSNNDSDDVDEHNDYGDTHEGGISGSGKFNFPDNDDITNDTSRIPTNPYQDVFGDCNDDGDDSIDPENDDSQDHLTVGNFPLEDAFPDQPGFQFKAGTRGVYYIHEGNNWQGDFSDNEGAINLLAKFDNNGRLSSLELHAIDNSDEGSFGILSMGFVFKPGCQEVAQIDERGEFGATVAFTDTVNPVKTFQNRLIQDTSGRGMDYPDACQPYGAIGAVAAAPTNGAGDPVTPWTYVARRAETDYEQCRVNDFTLAANYLRERPEDLPAAEKNFSLRRLFRKIFGVWTYQKLNSSGGGGDYTLLDDTPGTSGAAYDETGIADIASLALRGDLSILAAIFGGDFSPEWYAPRVASVRVSTCDATGLCKPGTVDSISVNGKDEGILLGADGALIVTAKFFAWASHNSMPILQRTISWGDFTPAEPASKGWYRNQKPLCSPDATDANAIGECRGTPGLTCDSNDDCPDNECLPNRRAHFGNTPGACAAAPYQFDHTYTCSAKDLNAMPACTGSSEAADNAPCYRMINSSPVCVYRPKVQIVDNWGWCNCTGSACPEDDGAYKSGCSLTNAPANAKPWTEFAGEIRLAPTVADAETAAPGSAVSGSGSSFFPGFFGGSSLLAP